MNSRDQSSLRDDCDSDVMTQGTSSIDNSEEIRINQAAGRVNFDGRRRMNRLGSRKQSSRTRNCSRLQYNASRNLRLPVHGDRVRRKKIGHVRIFYENVDGLVPISERYLSNETKIARLKNIFRRMEVDMAAFSEVRLQWNMVSYNTQLSSIFRSENELKTIAGFNEHEAFTKQQQGGTCILVGNNLTNHVVEMGADGTGLGRWCWVRFQGQDGYTSRIITAYQPCRSGRIEGNNTYAQHRRYFRAKGDRTCPLVHFRQDLEQQLLTWKQNGDRLLLLGDFNEDCQKGPIQRLVTSKSLNMVDVIHSITKRQSPATWIHGRKQIDAAFASKNFNVSRGCLLPFFIGVGDHRGIVLDIPHETLLGARILTVVRPSARRLQCTAKVQQTYIKHLEKYCKEHKVLQKTQQLLPNLHFPLSPLMCQQLNKIDGIRESGMKYAEQKCRKLMMGNVDFSPEVNVWGRRAYMWKLVLRVKDGQRISRSKIKRLAKSCDIKCPLSNSRSVVQQFYQRARREYLRRKPHAPALRESFLEGSVKDHYLNGNDKEIQHLKNMLQRESQRKSWRAINRCTKPGRMKGVSKVEVQVNGHWTRIESQSQIERAIMSENSKRFRLTETTPLMAEPMKRELGYLGNTRAADAILAGTYNIPNGVDEFTSLLLKELQRPTTTQIETKITTQDFQAYWRVARERTASSLSGLHFGHYKAAATSTYISSIHALLTSIASIYAFSFDRWRKGLSVMLEKVEGVIRVDKLRAILLMEADFNFHNKEIFGRRMIAKAESDGTLPEDQYGSRKNHRAIEVAFNRLLYFDILRLKRRNGALASVDAAQCYDRIVHSMLSLCCQHYGVPVTAVVCMLSAIQNMKFYLRTAYGDSTLYYGGSSSVPFQGTCQGNGASPAVWLVVSALIIRCMYSLGNRMEFKSALSLSPVEFTAFSFVDDTDLPRVSLSTTEPVENVIQTLQKSIMTWNGLLGSTGGALRPEKCYWYLIWFKWTSTGGWRYAKSTENMNSIVVPDCSGEPRSIEHLDVSKAKEAVGCLQRADGNMSDEFSRCQNLLNDWANKVKNGELPKKLAWQGLRGQLWASIQYRLSVTTFSKKEGDLLINQLYWELLPKLGTSRNFPLVYRSASLSYFGLNMPHPYIEQGIAATEMLLVYGNSNCLSGALLQVVVEQLQLEVGSEQFFLHLDHKKWGGYITKCWLWSVWKFISTHGITIHTKLKLPKKQRLEDRFIMDEIHRHTSDIAILRSVNRCRIYLEILTLADMATGDGSKVRDNIIQVERLVGEESNYEWPKEQPCTNDKRIWRSMIATLLSGGYTITPSLGMWTTQGHRENRWFYSPITRLVYKKSCSTYLVYSSFALICPRRGWSFSLSGVASILPVDAARATVRVVDLRTIIYEGCACIFNDITLPPHSIIDALKCDKFCYMFNNITIPDDGLNIARGIAEGTMLCVSDGSYQDQLTTQIGSAAWILENTQSGSQCKGVCLTPDGEAGSYRAELTGLYGMLCVISATCKVHNITNGKVQIGCDNDQGVRNASLMTKKVQQKLKCVDLVRAIRHIKAQIPVQLEFIEITGHLDEEADFEELDRASQLNIFCDTIAKKFLREAFHQGVFNGGSVPHEEWGISLGKTKLTSSIGKHIRNAISHSDLRAYLHKKGKLTWRVFNQIDWEAIGNMMNESTITFRVWISKHVSGFCGVGRRMKLMGYWENSLCPCCKQEEETTWHIARCMSTQMQMRFDTVYSELAQWLRQNHTEPELEKGILLYVKGRGNQPFDLPNGSTSLHRDLEDQMNNLGWDHFIEGKIPILMGNLQGTFLHQIGHNKSNKSWTKGLVFTLTRGLLSLWIERNGILHKRDKNGLKLKESQTLKENIQEHIDQGKDDLEGLELEAWNRATTDIFNWSGEDQKSWLHTMNIAREQSDDINDSNHHTSENAHTTTTNQNRGRKRKQPSQLTQSLVAKRRNTNNRKRRHSRT